MLTTLLIVIFGVALPYSPLARVLGFVALPVLFFPFLIVATLTYLGLVELAKRGPLGHVASSQRHDGGP